jgi:hypothetical protein
LRHGAIDAAGRVDGGSDVWNLPRYVCGHHWSAPEALESILRDARSRA